MCQVVRWRGGELMCGVPLERSVPQDVQSVRWSGTNNCLFLIEAGLEGAIGAQYTETIDLILEKTGYLLPLAVRSAGRYVKTCRTLRTDTGLSQIADVLTRATNSSRMSPLTEMLDCSFHA